MWGNSTWQLQNRTPAVGRPQHAGGNAGQVTVYDLYIPDSGQVHLMNNASAREHLNHLWIRLQEMRYGKITAHGQCLQFYPESPETTTGFLRRIGLTSRKFENVQNGYARSHSRIGIGTLSNPSFPRPRLWTERPVLRDRK